MYVGLVVWDERSPSSGKEKDQKEAEKTTERERALDFLKGLDDQSVMTQREKRIYYPYNIDEAPRSFILY